MRVFHRNESCPFCLLPSTKKEGNLREDRGKLVALISMKNSGLKTQRKNEKTTNLTILPAAFPSVMRSAKFVRWLHWHLV